MKNKQSKGSLLNLVFSSFLVIGYIICTFFFSSLAAQLSGFLGGLVQVLMMVLFGLLLFYATRVGDGKQVKRFSLPVLLLIVIPTLYIILAFFLPRTIPGGAFVNPQEAQQAMALGAEAAPPITYQPSIILMLASVAFGYAIPYTFFSGYEMASESEEGEADSEVKPLEGGLAEELAETEADETTELNDDDSVDEIVDDSEKTEVVEEDVTDAPAEEKAEAEEAVEEAVEEVAEEADKSEE